MKHEETAKRLQQILGTKNMKAQELSDRSGVAKASISQYINGTHKPSNVSAGKMAKVLEVDPLYLMGFDVPMKKSTLGNVKATTIKNNGRIPVYGRIAAGIPLEANVDIVDEIDVPANWVDDHGALIVQGDSMYPKYQDGDIVIFRQQPDCESGTDCVVYVNGYDATLKTVYKKDDGILLQPINPAYDPMFYGKDDDPVMIAGIIVELRRKV